jgi:hypothetical protein
MWDCEACVLCVHPNLRKTSHPLSIGCPKQMTFVGYNDFYQFVGTYVQVKGTQA